MKAFELAMPLRLVAQKLLQERLKDKNQRAKVAKALGKSIKTVEAALYQGRGGFDTLAAALIVAYDLEDRELEAFVKDLSQALKELEGGSEADKLWRELDKYFSEEEKVHWAKVMNLYGQLSKNQN